MLHPDMFYTLFHGLLDRDGAELRVVRMKTAYKAIRVLPGVSHGQLVAHGRTPGEALRNLLREVPRRGPEDTREMEPQEPN